jgi:hypothetical protein
MSSITHAAAATKVATTTMAADRFVTSTMVGIAVACAGLISSSQASAQATPKQIADTLVSNQNGQVVQILEHANGYTIRRPMDCVADPNPNGLAYHCEMLLDDEHRNGAAASLQFMISNKNINFNTSNANLKAAVAGQPGSHKFLLDTTLRRKDQSGNKLSIPGTCHQSAGHPNGPAVCAFLLEPRVLMLSIVNPAKADFENGDNAEADIDHAQPLALLGLMMLDTAR